MRLVSSSEACRIFGSIEGEIAFDIREIQDSLDLLKTNFGPPLEIHVL